jgi:hypothetical protein
MSNNFYSKYDAIISFIDDPTVDIKYKILQEVEDELHSTLEYQTKNKITSNINNSVVYTKKVKNKN